MALLRPLHVEMPQPRPAAPGRGELLLRLIAHENLHRLDPGNLLLHQDVRRRQICQWQRDRELRRAAESRGDEGLHRGEHIRAIALVHLRDDPSGGILGPERGLERAPTLISLLNVTLIILTLSVSRLLNLLLRLVAFLLFLNPQCLASISRWITASSSWKRFCLFVCRALSSIMVICMLTAIRLLLTFVMSLYLLLRS